MEHRAPESGRSEAYRFSLQLAVEECMLLPFSSGLGVSVEPLFLFGDVCAEVPSGAKTDPNGGLETKEVPTASLA